LKRDSRVLLSLLDYSSHVDHQPWFRKSDKLVLPFSNASGFSSATGEVPDRKRIMICDDESDVLLAYKIAIASKYSVLTASSGEECLRKYDLELRSGGRVDVLLLDYRLGDMQGDEIACKIRDLDGTKVILISAYEISASFLNELREKNCITSFIKKPITMSSLLGIIDKTLNE
jgi:DNA-binding NtrC family response regulator